MLSTEWRRVYKRLAILGLLVACCVFTFISSDEVRSVGSAARCIQDCERSENLCNDSCQTSCDENSTDADCNSCLTNCNVQSNRCSQGAVNCVNTPENPAPACTVDYGTHCPIIGGTPHCDNASGGHNGYFMICSIGGGQQCVSCPDHDFCTGSNNLPACFR